jgi:queuine tRNA-ribosyltransferase
MFKFEIEAELPNGLGRAGVISTPHGAIRTPAFMVVGTRGEVRHIPMSELHGTGAQAMLSNGYHLRRKAAEIAAAGGLAKWSGWEGPTLTDSGGFQVMSLGSGLGKVVSMKRDSARITSHKERLATVEEEGVRFVDPENGEPDFIGPEESMRIQGEIGADIMMSFDELTSLADDYDYNVQAMERTHRWGERCLAVAGRNGGDYQALYGVLQGGRWEDLRRATARYLSGLKVSGREFDGFGLGGAFLKEDLGEILRWCNEELPREKPRHLLGLSRPDDIFVGAEMGADTFDCVAPTREARHGRIYTLDGDINLRKFRDSGDLLDEECDCRTCRGGWTRGQLRELMKSTEKGKYYELASVHNVRFIVRLTEQVRESILRGDFYDFRDRFLGRYYGKM